MRAPSQDLTGLVALTILVSWDPGYPWVQIWSRITKSGFCVVNVQKAYFWRYHRFLDNLKKHVLVGTVGYKVTKGKLWVCRKQKNIIFFRIPHPSPSSRGMRSANLVICKGNQRICCKIEQKMLENDEKSRKSWKITDIPDFQNFFKQLLAGTVY